MPSTAPSGRACPRRMGYPDPLIENLAHAAARAGLMHTSQHRKGEKSFSGLKRGRNRMQEFFFWKHWELMTVF